MSSGKEVGKLYAYFLEASKRFIHFEIHVANKIRLPGEGMYQDLVQKLADGCDGTYTKIISQHDYFTVEQKNCLTPANGIIIDKRKLDFTIYFQIYLLLGGSRNWPPMHYMRNTRNLLCHYSLFLTGKDFDNEWFIMRLHFQEYNFEKEFLDWCDREIKNAPANW